MPKYDFKCQECGTIEITKGMLEEDPTNCPDCGNPISRVWGGNAVGVSFKGKGFYSTDNRKSSGKKD